MIFHNNTIRRRARVFCCVSLVENILYIYRLGLLLCTYRSELFEIALHVLQRCGRRQTAHKDLFRSRHHLPVIEIVKERKRESMKLRRTCVSKMYALYTNTHTHEERPT